MLLPRVQPFNVCHPFIPGTPCSGQVQSSSSCVGATGLTAQVFQLPLAIVGWLICVTRAGLFYPPPPHPVDADHRFPRVTANAISAVSRYCPTPSGDLALPQQRRLLTCTLLCLAQPCLSVYLVHFACLLGCHPFSPVSRPPDHVTPMSPWWVGRLSHVLNSDVSGQ